MSGEQIIFSVIIPVYNRADLLQRAIRSVLAQTFANYQIVVVDDGSLEPVATALAEVPAGKLKYVKIPNMGAAIARNVGIGLAGGEWIAFLDSDDAWLPQKLQRVYEYIKVHGPTFSYYSGFRAVNSSTGKVIDETIETREPENYTRALTTGNPIRVFSSFVARRELIFSVNGLDKTFKARQDVDLYMRLSQVASFKYVPEVLCEVYRGAEGSITSNPRNRLQGFVSYYNKHIGLLSFRNKSYLSKRIVYYAWKSRAWGTILKYIVRALPSIVFKVK
jgi:glycosyltransferase involved in cell wall biosynthesis